MRLTYLLFFISASVFSQTSFSIDTQFKKISKEVFKKEHFSFVYNEETGIFKMTDKDLAVTKELNVDFFDSVYSRDGSFYILFFEANLEKIKKSDLVDKVNFPSTIAIYYDKKMGNVLYVDIYYGTKYSDGIKIKEQPQSFFTSYGKDIISKE